MYAEREKYLRSQASNWVSMPHSCSILSGLNCRISKRRPCRRIDAAGFNVRNLTRGESDHDQRLDKHWTYLATRANSHWVGESSCPSGPRFCHKPWSSDSRMRAPHLDRDHEPVAARPIAALVALLALGGCAARQFAHANLGQGTSTANPSDTS
jgi:hypothetical protein